MPDDRPTDAALATRRPPTDLRARRQHGRAGDPAPARTASAAARGRGRVRLGHELLPPLLRLRGSRRARAGCRCSRALEVGGTPTTNPTGYVLRSPTHWLEEIARSGVPLQIWWSLADAIVVDQTHQSAHFYDELRTAPPASRGRGRDRLLAPLSRDAPRHAVAGCRPVARAAPRAVATQQAPAPARLTYDRPSFHLAVRPNEDDSARV